MKFHWGTSLHSFKAVVKSIDVGVHLLLQRGPAAAGQRRDEPRAVRARRQLGPAEPDVGHAASRTAPTRCRSATRSTASRPATTATRRSGAASPPPTASPTRSTCARARAGDPGAGALTCRTTTSSSRADDRGQRRRDARPSTTTPSSTCRVLAVGVGAEPAHAALQRPRLRASSTATAFADRRRRSRSSSRTTASGTAHRASTARSSASAPTRAPTPLDACELVVTALDRATGSGTTTGVACSRSRSTPTSSRKIAQRGGPAGRRSTTRQVDTFDYLIQTTTNYAFLDEIAFRTGFEWRVEGKTLHFEPRAPSGAGRGDVRRATSAGSKPGSRRQRGDRRQGRARGTR